MEPVQERRKAKALPQKNKALVVVDVQAGFLTEYTSRCLPRIYELLDSDEFSLVVATRFSNPAGSVFRTRIGWDGVSTRDEIRLDSRVEQRADAVVDKTTYGAGEELLDIFDEFGVSRATLVGIDTDVCVLHNAAYLFDHDVEVDVDLDGCATNGGPEADAAAVNLMARTVGSKYITGRPGGH